MRSEFSPVSEQTLSALFLRQFPLCQRPGASRRSSTSPLEGARTEPETCLRRDGGKPGMNLTPTERERLTIFSAAEFARRNRALGIRLSHPEAIALITDEVMTAARRDMPYQEIRDMAGRLLTADDVMPGVADMIQLIMIECSFR